MAFVRLPLIVAGIAVAYAFFALRGHPDALALSLVTPPFVMLFVNLASLWLLVWLTRREGLRLADLIGFDRARAWRDVGWGLVWLVVLNVPYVLAIMAMTVAITRPASADELGPAFQRVFAGPAGDLTFQFPLWWAIVVALSFSLLNPVVEELHYRGYVQPRLGLVLTAVGFALQHVAFAVSLAGAAVYVVAFFVWGLGAGLVYRWQRRLTPLIVTHFAINASFGVLPLVVALVT
jgi:membrane protease YdiL (CAAX protease family)